MSRLCYLLYSSLIFLRLDYKLDEQLDAVVAVVRGNNISYQCASDEDHLWQSIPKNEIIICKIDNNIVVDNAENIYNRKKELLVPTYNNGDLIWEKGIIRRENNKTNKIYDFQFTPNAFVRVTEGHSMLIWDSENSSLKEIKAKEVKMGDLVLSVDNFNIVPEKKYKQINIQFIWKFKKNEKRTLIVDEDFAYLLGWASAEGSQSGDGAYTLALNNDDPAEKLLNIFRKVFNITTGRINKYLNNWGHYQQTVTFGGGQKVSDLIHSLVGRGSHNKKVPEIIFNSSKNVQEAFLKGLIEGDGNNEGRLTTVSYQIACGVVTLGKLIGKDYTIDGRHLNKHNNYEYNIIEGKRRGYYNNIPLEAFKIKYNKSRGKTINREKLKNWKQLLCILIIYYKFYFK